LGSDVIPAPLYSQSIKSRRKNIFLRKKKKINILFHLEMHRIILVKLWFHVDFKIKEEFVRLPFAVGDIATSVRFVNFV